MAYAKQASLVSCSVQDIFMKKSIRLNWKLKSLYRITEWSMWKWYTCTKINTIHGVERFVVLPLRKLKGQKPQRCMCAVICTVTNCSHYFHNEMYYFKRGTLLRITFSVFRQAALLLSCYGLGQGVQIDFSFIQQECINLLLFLHYSPLLHYTLHEVKNSIKL